MELGFVTSTFVFAFALVQVPLGIALDTIGARKTQTVLFVAGSIGLIIFGLASSVWQLALGRAIMGIGMAGGLMAALKAISKTVDPRRTPFFNGSILAAGGVGALVATAPAKLLEVEIGWRMLCFGLAGVSLLIAALIYVTAHRETPPSGGERPTIRSEIDGLKIICADAFFWRDAPLFMISAGGFVAMQGLWLGPWLEHVVELSPQSGAVRLSVVAIAMTFGLLSGGLFSRLADYLGWPLLRVVTVGITVHIVTQIVIVTNVLTSDYIIWFFYGYFAQVAWVTFAIIGQHFGSDLSGRAETFANMLLFMCAFLIQYLYGLVVHLWPSGGGTEHPAIAYKVAYSGVIALECAALAWFIIRGFQLRTLHREQK